MATEDVLQKLLAITDEEWRTLLRKSHRHIKLKIKGKVIYGAHSEKRLGMPAEDYYTTEAIKALYETNGWRWQYDKYSIEEQVIRIIDSKISNEVEKYKVEKKRHQSPFVTGLEDIGTAIEDIPNEEVESSNLERYTKVLAFACDGNEADKKFIELRKEGLNYDEISKEMSCSIEKLYQRMENISRRAHRKLESIDQNT